jgi:adenosine deaminase
LSECFEIFDLIHAIMNNKQTLKRVTYEALCDFYNDNVVYLELRTTPRDLPDGTTKRQYIDTVLDVIREFTFLRKDFHVKLLLSIDRASRDFEDCKHTINLCIEYFTKDNIVVGLDVGGNPTRGSLAKLEPLLDRAREYKVPITLHCGEVQNDEEMEFVLKFTPDRLGHALFLNQAHVNELLNRPTKRRIPIELCPTSNMKTLLLDTLDHHPTAKRWIAEGVCLYLF